MKKNIPPQNIKSGKSDQVMAGGKVNRKLKKFWKEFTKLVAARS